MRLEFFRRQYLDAHIDYVPDEERHGFCAEALGDALARYGQPEIFNTDQGSQFTSSDFTGVLKNASMCNIFPFLWRSLTKNAIDEQIERHERVFAELNFNGDAFFLEVGLVV